MCQNVFLVINKTYSEARLANLKVRKGGDSYESSRINSWTPTFIAHRYSFLHTYVSSRGVIFESLRRRYLDRIPFFQLTVCPHTRNPDYSTYYHIQSRTRACARCSRAPYPFTGRLMFHKDDVRSLSLLHRRPRRKRQEIKQWRDLHNARAPLLLLHNIRRRVCFL